MRSRDLHRRHRLAWTRHLRRAVGLGLLALTFGWSAAATDGSWIEEPASFSNGEVPLAGTFFVPPDAGPRPAVVVLHGSGAESRRPYLPDARMLARNGIAALVFDKRGTGASGGDLGAARLDDLRDDAVAAVDWLRGHPRVDPGSIGVLGVSQGGWLAPFVAAATPDVAFFVQVTAAATPLAVQELWGTGHGLERLGYAPSDVATAMRANRLFFSARPLLRSGVLPVAGIWFTNFDPWLDPRQAWHEVDVPALVLLAGADATVPSALTQSRLDHIADARPSLHLDVVVLDAAAHALGGSRRNDDSDYVELVTGWITSASDNDPPLNPTSTGQVVADPAWFEAVTDGRSWHTSVWIHLPAMLLIVVVSLRIAVWGLRRRGEHDARPSALALASVARILAGLSAVASLLVVIGVVAAIVHLLDADASSLPPPVPLSDVTATAAWLGLAATVSLLAIRQLRPRTANLRALGVGWLPMPGVVAFALAWYWGRLPGLF